MLAAATTKLRLGTGIALVPQRNPIYTAKEFATLDYLTNGRMDLGVGVGWCKEEVIACGYDWSTRGRRCDEFLELFQKLWTEDEVSYEGDFLSVEKVRLDPKTCPKNLTCQSSLAVTLMRLIEGPRGLERVGMVSIQIQRRPLKAMNRLDGFLAEAGRERGDDFEIIITPPYQVNAEMIEQYAQIGVDRIVVQLGGQRPEQIDKRFAMLESLVRECG